MKQYFSLNPSRAALRQADMARDARDWGAAASHYQSFLARNPDVVPIWIQYGHALKESGRFSDAHAAYAKAIALEPENSDAHLHLGHLQKITGRIAAAQESYTRARDLDGNPDAVHELESLAAQLRLPFAIKEAAALGGGNLETYIQRFSEQIDYILTHLAAVKTLGFEVAQIKNFLPVKVDASPHETMRATAAALVLQLDALALAQEPTERTLGEVSLLINRLEAIRGRSDDAL